MCNCGNKRQKYGAGQYVQPGSHTHIETPKSKIYADAYFEYTGLSALSVTGNITGKHYRFSQTGSIELVDYRDTAGMMSVPVLRKVNK